MAQFLLCKLETRTELYFTLLPVKFSDTKVASTIKMSIGKQITSKGTLTYSNVM